MFIMRTAAMDIVTRDEAKVADWSLDKCWVYSNSPFSNLNNLNAYKVSFNPNPSAISTRPATMSMFVAKFA